MAVVGDGSRSNVNLAFLVGGLCAAAGWVFIECAFALMNRHPAMILFKRSKPEMKLKVATEAEDEDEWIDSMCASLRSQLTKGDPNYRNWNGHHGDIQRMLKRILDNWLPTLPKFEGEGDEGRLAHYELMLEWIHRYANDEEILTIHGGLPHIPMPNFNEHLLDPVNSHAPMHDVAGSLLQGSSQRSLSQRSLSQRSLSQRSPPSQILGASSVKTL